MRRKLMMMLLLTCCLGLMAQAGQTVWTISGKVVDGRSRKPIPFASVANQGVGTVTNEDGEFVLKLRQAPQSVTVSCVGYKTRREGIATQSGYTISLGEIRLSTSAVVLSEIVVRGADAKDVVLKAIDKIEDNYARLPNLMRGFYRETVQKRQRFVGIAEGVVEMYKSPYHKRDWRDGVAIQKGRRLLSQRSGDTLAVKLQGGPVLPIHLDLVKERNILLNADELNNYAFSFALPEKAGDRMLYVVEMRPRLVMPYPLYKGRLYIDQETLAFTKIDLELDMNDQQKVTEMILRKRPVGLRFTPRELTLTIDYQTVDGVTRINYIRNVIRFRCDWKRKLFKSNFTVTSEMVVTSLQEGEGVRSIRGRDTFNRRDNFYDKVIYFEDPDFWGDENIIEPTEDLLNGIEKIRRRLR